MFEIIPWWWCVGLLIVIDDGGGSFFIMGWRSTDGRKDIWIRHFDYRICDKLKNKIPGYYLSILGWKIQIINSIFVKWDAFVVLFIAHKKNWYHILIKRITYILQNIEIMTWVTKNWVIIYIMEHRNTKFELICDIYVIN